MGIIENVITQKGYFFCVVVVTFDFMFPPANTQNNLETSDVSKSQHFSMAASLLEVSAEIE